MSQYEIEKYGQNTAQRIVTSNAQFLYIAAVSAILIVGAYGTNRYLLLIPAVICSIYIFLAKDMNQATAILFFMLAFSGIFKLSAASGSLYKILEVAYVIRFFYRRGELRANYIFSLLIFTLISATSFIWSDYVEISRLENLVLWFVVLMCIFRSFNKETFSVMGKGFILGVLISCVLASLSGLIPNLSSEIKTAQITNMETSKQIIRFMGLWNDPNTFSAFVCLALTTNLKIYTLKKESAAEFIIYSAALTIFGLLSLSKMSILIVLGFWVVAVSAKSGLQLNKKIVMVFTILLTAYLAQDFFAEILNTYIYRFSVDAGNNYSIDSLTTHRYSIWVTYLDRIRSIFDWLFGCGLSAMLVNRRASHNTYIQIVFNIGLVGLISYTAVFIELAKSLDVRKRMRSRFNTIIDFLPLCVILLIAFFLDYFFIESFYFMVGLAILSIYAVDYSDETIQLL